MSDQQHEWDAEATAAFQRRLAHLASQVRQALAEEGKLREAKRRTAQDRSRADGLLSIAIESALTADYMSRLQQAVTVAETAADAEREARQQWQLQVVRRRKLQDELRAAVRAQFRALPLYDRPHYPEETPAGAAARPRRRQPKEATP